MKTDALWHFAASDTLPVPLDSARTARQMDGLRMMGLARQERCHGGRGLWRLTEAGRKRLTEAMAAQMMKLWRRGADA